ncbi:hypothetical protein [Candidatus Nitrosocosmicus oleophilus]|uniref:hypothetical protein n=1 Tax=Candidatus Nitrosocosmicus oleophilus TaxID=1353260 RepID=UPI0018C92E0D|nr:hypothetical protein [Candidatus Nitrosocosmicus oleophilus]
MGQENFERLAQALVQRFISPSAKIYGRGRDGGRDAVYIGKSTYDKQYPTNLEPWDGHWIFQAKFHNTDLRGHQDARSELLSEIEPELDTIVNVNKLQCDNYVIITNVSLTSVPESGTRDKLEKRFEELKPKYKVKNIGIWSASEIDGFLINNPELTRSFESLRSPFDIAKDLFHLNYNLEVSCISLSIPNLGTKEILQSLSNALNVQKEINEEPMPYVFTDELSKIVNRKVLFLYGRSGIGKSRTILELTKSLLNQGKTIYLINPFSTQNKINNRKSLLSIVSNIHSDDILIWDNFPNDLVHRNINDARKALDLLISKECNVIMSLNPFYPESYSDLVKEIPEIDTYKIRFDKKDLKKLIHSYGSEVSQFRQVYASDIQHKIEEISDILWKKDPSPMLILEYYRELTNVLQNYPSSFDSIIIAQRLEGSKEYYNRQFKFLKSNRKYDNLVHFLYTLKVCYELGISRGLDQLEILQSKIFKTSPPPEPLDSLNNWLYLSGQYYSLHDIARDSINFNPDNNLKLTYYIKNNPNLITENDNTLYLGGIFIGRNIQYLYSGPSNPLLPTNFDILTNKANAIKSKQSDLIKWLNENKIGMGDPRLTRAMVESVNRDKDYFGLGLGTGLGQSFIAFDQTLKSDMWNNLTKLFEEYPEVAYGFGKEAGNVFKNIENEYRCSLWDKFIETCNRNGDFALGLGESISNILEFLDEKDLTKIRILISNNMEFISIFPISLMQRILLTETSYFKDPLVSLLAKDNKIAKTFSDIFHITYEGLSPELQMKIFKEIENCKLLSYIRLNDLHCSFCKQFISPEEYHEHMTISHPKIIAEIKRTEGQYEKCKFCDATLKNEINETLRHFGENHYDVMPSHMKTIYEKWKMAGFPELDSER